MKNEGVRLAVLENSMEEMKKGMDDMRVDIRALTKSVDTLVSARLAEQVELKAEITALKKEVVELNDDIKAVRSSNSPTKTWIKHSLSGALGSALTFLVIEYLKNAGR